MAEDFVGARIRYWRLKRGVSQRTLAGLAGVSQSFVSQVEAGLKEIDRRSTLVHFADALQVSVAELVGQPYAPDDPQHARALAAVPEIRAALVGLAYLDIPAKPSRPLAALEAAVGELMRCRRLCEYADAAQLIAPLVRDLGATAYAAGAKEVPAALRLLALTTHNAAFVLKYLGFVDLSLAAAERCHDAARDLCAPEWVGLAEYSRLHTLPPESRAVGRKLAAATTDRLSHELTSPAVMQAYGMLHLTTAWTEALAGDLDAARSHLDEAAEVADRIGPDPIDGGFAQMNFGPTNVAQWRMSLALEAGEPGRAVELSREIHPDAILSPSRVTAFHIDVGSALAASRRNDAEALTQFIRAERVAPQRVRLSPVVRDTVGAMLRRARADAGGDTLRGLAARVGVA
ncbi:helix-turn-helix domain-containing protein [Couchioplanes caeruleus]|uniref:helix-turn-helix domain-containing protein n=1 Tax=Couchioplanes caeruleus TaxID=56438 RepID=UPI0020BED6E9|nr:helix-turn-helix transcriptional regulator [Couchioplanes caeruleus]UQU64876.1 helix-turn-helix domain-containing protein [Couchioplanes caeruleus]